MNQWFLAPINLALRINQISECDMLKRFQVKCHRKSALTASVLFCVGYHTEGYTLCRASGSVDVFSHVEEFLAVGGQCDVFMVL